MTSASVPNWLPKLEGLDTTQLMARREELVRKSRNSDGKLNGGQLPDEELQELCAIFAILRKRASPSASKAKAPPAPMSMSDVPADL